MSFFGILVRFFSEMRSSLRIFGAAGIPPGVDPTAKHRAPPAPGGRSPKRPTREKKLTQNAKKRVLRLSLTMAEAAVHFSRVGEGVDQAGCLNISPLARITYNSSYSSRRESFTSLEVA